MADKNEIRDFVKQLQKYSGQKINYPAEVGGLLQCAIDSELTSVFEGLIFEAKFLVKSHAVIGRVGPGGEGFQKLTEEFTASLERSVVSINKIIEKSDSAVAGRFGEMFLDRSTAGMNNLLALLNDLSWIKNWQIDGKPMPYHK